MVTEEISCHPSCMRRVRPNLKQEALDHSSNKATDAIGELPVVELIQEAEKCESYLIRLPASTRQEAVLNDLCRPGKSRDEKLYERNPR
ncbi:MAG TPA: hypothetical protein VMR31_03260 [Myxococcota bacterium]|nr:hypothetical protein [Myxococcota bacterium]